MIANAGSIVQLDIQIKNEIIINANASVKSIMFTKKIISWNHIIISYVFVKLASI